MVYSILDVKNLGLITSQLDNSPDSVLFDQDELHEEYLMDVDINGTSVTNLTDMFAIDHSYHMLKSNNDNVDGHFAITPHCAINDTEYFIKLLVARSELKRALYEKMQDLMLLRKVNQQLSQKRTIRKRTANRKNAKTLRRKYSGRESKNGVASSGVDHEGIKNRKVIESLCKTTPEGSAQIGRHSSSVNNGFVIEPALFVVEEVSPNVHTEINAKGKRGM